LTEPERRYYDGIKELLEANDFVEANRLLSLGWELLSIKERATFTPDGKESRGPCYILGRRGRIEGPATHPAQGQAPSPPAPPSAASPPSASTEAGTKFFSCRYCGRPIRWKRDVEGKWRPRDRDGSDHLCWGGEKK